MKMYVHTLTQKKDLYKNVRNGLLNPDVHQQENG